MASKYVVSKRESYLEDVGKHSVYSIDLIADEKEFNIVPPEEGKVDLEMFESYDDAADYKYALENPTVLEIIPLLAKNPNGMTTEQIRAWFASHPEPERFIRNLVKWLKQGGDILERMTKPVYERRRGI